MNDLNSTVNNPAGQASSTGGYASLKCVYADCVRKGHDHKAITILAALALVRSGQYKDKIESIRQIKFFGGHDLYQKTKLEQLPLFVFQGLAIEGAGLSNKNIRACNGLMVLDIDHLSEDELVSTKETLSALPYVVFVIKSPGGDGLKVGVLTDFTGDVNPKAYAARYKHVASVVSDRVPGVDLDKSCSNIARLCYVSNDPDLYQADPAKVTPFPLHDFIDPIPAPRKYAHMDIPEAEIIRMLACVDPDMPYDDWWKIIMALKEQSESLFSVAYDWSQTGGNPIDWNELEYKWGTIGNEGDDLVGMGTIFWHATTNLAGPNYRPLQDQPDWEAVWKDLQAKHAAELNLGKIATAIARAHEAICRIKGVAPETLTSSHGAGKFQLKSISSILEDIRPTDWLIKDYLAADSTAEIFGKPGDYKTFVAVGMACCIATGRPWMGQDVKKGMVVYIAGEGNSHLGKRFQAWSQKEDTPLDDTDFYLSTRSASFSEVDSLVEVVDTITDKVLEAKEVPSIVVIDTLARNFGPGDENSTSDMSAFVDSLEEIQQAFPGITVILIHHSGLVNTDRARGSSVLNAAIDTEFRVRTADDDVIEVESTKTKDSATPPTLVLKPEVITLNMDKPGEEPITSVALIHLSDQERAALQRRTEREEKSRVVYGLWKYVKAEREDDEYPTKTDLKALKFERDDGGPIGKDKFMAWVEDDIEKGDGNFKWVDMPKDSKKRATKFLDIAREEFRYSDDN